MNPRCKDWCEGSCTVCDPDFYLSTTSNEMPKPQPKEGQ